MKSKIILNQLLIGATALVFSLKAEPQYYQNHEKGWHWYEIQEVEEKPEPAVEVLSTDSDKKEETKRKSPKEIVASYREELENRLADAWMHPTPHKIKAYQEMQQDMVERSKTFSEGWMKNVFLNPELDNTIANPVNQQARHVQLDLQKKQVVETIKNLAKEYGLFFFFSGECEFCHRFAPIVKHFSDQYGWQVLPISLDGGQLELFPNAQPDNGLFEQWQQGGQGQGQVMPALYAVNPNTGHVIPIALGMTSIDQMETRIMSLVKMEGSL
jgi:conjugal transfer pilus assembly protein TraF